LPGATCVDLDEIACAYLESQTDSDLLHAITPWGVDAIFNRNQAPRLLSELRRVAADADEAIKAALLTVANFIEEQAPVADPSRIYYIVVLSD
jgi:hypothetical protein